MQSLQGQLLVASHQLADSNFARSVVLIVRHDTDGALGLILNRRTNRGLEEIWEQISDKTCKCDAPLYFGGPVPGPLMALHRHEPLADAEVLPGAYFCVERDKLEELLEHNDGSFKLFVGHSGWAGGQLEQELEVGGWRTAAATIEHIFQGENELWEQVNKELGIALLRSALDIKDVPEDPSVN
jgi:putative transcriptional regulator